MRPHYAEFSKHAMRYYVRSVINSSSQCPRFKTESDKKNWYACQSALTTFPAEDRDLLLRMYITRDNMPQNIYDLSKKENIKQDRLWGLVNDFERVFAKKRGLIG